MRRGRPKAPLTLTDDERETLERWVRRPTTAQALAQRARIVLACVSGGDNSARPGDQAGAACARSRRCSITTRRPSTRCSMPRPPHLGREGHARRSPPMLVADLHREAARRGGTWTRCRSPSGRTRCSSPRRAAGRAHPRLCGRARVSGVGSLGPRWWNTFRFQSSTRWPASTRTPEGASILRKEVAFKTAATPMLAAEIVRHAHAIAARVRQQASTGEATS